MSEITDSIEIVPLETKEEAFIGMACQIETHLLLLIQKVTRINFNSRYFQKRFSLVLFEKVNIAVIVYFLKQK